MTARATVGAAGGLLKRVPPFPATVLTAGLGLLACSLADALSRATESPTQLLFWGGLLLIGLPIFYRLTSREARGRRTARPRLPARAQPLLREDRPRRADLHLPRRAGPRLQRQPDRQPSRAVPAQLDPPHHSLLPGPRRRHLGADLDQRPLRLHGRPDRRRRGAAGARLGALPALPPGQRLGQDRRAGRRPLRRQLQLPLLGRAVLLRVPRPAAAGRDPAGAGRARSGAALGGAVPGRRRWRC